MAEIGTPADKHPSIRISYEIDVLKSFIRNVAFGLQEYALSNTSFMRPTLPFSLQIRVIALSYLSKMGMITTSFITSHISMTPLKALISLSIRSSCFFMIVALSYSMSQGAHTVCQHKGWPLTVTPLLCKNFAALKRSSSSVLPSSLS